MNVSDWFAALVGLALVGVALVDAWITIFHKDDEGPVSGLLRRSVQGIFTSLAGQFPGRRAALLASSGPVLLIATPLMWLGMYILGFAFMALPLIDGFQPDPELTGERRSFVDALYFSASATTFVETGMLGPASSGGQLLAIVQGTLGVVLVASIIAYVFNVLRASAQVSALALRVFGDTGNTGDGAALIINSARDEEPADLRLRLDQLVTSLRGLQETLQQYPILQLSYRSGVPSQGTDLLLRTAAQAALGGYLLSLDGRYRRMRPVSRHLCTVTIEALSTVSRSSLSRLVDDAIMSPEPQQADIDAAERLASRLVDDLGADLSAANEAQIRYCYEMAYRIRVFSDAVGGLTNGRGVVAPARS